MHSEALKNLRAIYQIYLYALYSVMLDLGTQKNSFSGLLPGPDFWGVLPIGGTRERSEDIRRKGAPFLLLLWSKSL